MILEIKNYCIYNFMLNINKFTILFCFPIGVVGNLKVTHIYWLCGYAVTPLRVLYCINKYTPQHLPLFFAGQKIVFYFPFFLSKKYESNELAITYDKKLGFFLSKRGFLTRPVSLWNRTTDENVLLVKIEWLLAKVWSSG